MRRRSGLHRAFLCAGGSWVSLQEAILGMDTVAEARETTNDEKSNVPSSVSMNNRISTRRKSGFNMIIWIEPTLFSIRFLGYFE